MPLLLLARSTLPPPAHPPPGLHTLPRGSEDTNIDPANRKCSDRIRYSTNSDPRASPHPPARPSVPSAPAPKVRSPYPAHAPLLSCDGGRPSHGRATLLLSGRLEAYDKFRWRAGGCRGSLAAVLCVIGPQGRQIAPPLAHALPQSSHDLANLFLVAHFLSLPFAGASFAGASRRALFCPSFEGEEWERDLLSII